MANPEARVMIGLATAGVVFAIHNSGMPPQADVRATGVGDDALESVRKQHAWVEAGVVSAIYLVTKDPIPFMLGGAMIVALDWLTRVNSFTNPATNSVIPNPFNVGVKDEPSPQAANYDASLYAVS